MPAEELTYLPPARVARNRLWSVERVLYGCAVLIGLWLRLWRLGYQPLSAWEASNSWSAWLAAHALSVADAPAPTSALFYSFQWLLFWTGVNSDGGARFASAVSGVGLILLIWWWRGVLGRPAALTAAFLIAIDPWLLGFSRLADGASLALLLGMLVLVAISQVVEQPAAKVWKRLLAIGAGLLVVAGAMGWNLLPVALGWGWLHREELRSGGMLERRWLLWAGGAALAGATLWFAQLDALAWVASGTSIWLSQFDGRSPGPYLYPVTEGYGWSWSWLRLWADAPHLLLLGLCGLGFLMARAAQAEGRDVAPWRLLYLLFGWLVWGTILWLLPGRSPLALPVLGLPLLILSAVALVGLVRITPREVDWREVAAVVATITILLVSGIFWLTALFATRNYDPVLAQATLVIFGLAVVILVAFGLWANRRDALWVSGALVAAILLVLSVRNSWKLNFNHVLTEPSGWQAAVAHPELRLLVNDMETLSAHRAGDPNELPIQVQVAAYVMQNDELIPARPDPVVGWQLRNMRNLSWVRAPQVAQDAAPLPLVVTPVIGEEEVAQLDLPRQYAGSRYRVEAEWLPNTLRTEDAAPLAEDSPFLRRIAETLRPWWRWLIYREPISPPQTRDVILWAPLDDNVP